MTYKKQASTPHGRNVCLRLKKCILSRYDLDLWPPTAKTFRTMPTRMVKISAKFHWNCATKYGDIASSEIGVNGRIDGRTTDG